MEGPEPPEGGRRRRKKVAPRILGYVEVHQATMTPATGRLEGEPRRPIAGMTPGQEGLTGGPRVHVGNEPNELTNGPDARAAAGADAETDGTGLAVKELRRRLAILPGVARKAVGRNTHERHAGDAAPHGPLLRRKAAVKPFGGGLPVGAVGWLARLREVLVSRRHLVGLRHLVPLGVPAGPGVEPTVVVLVA